MKRTLLYSAVTTALLLSQQVLAQDCSTLPIWQPEQSYNGGSQVQQNDSAYQAQWWTQGNSPVDYSGPWQEWKNLGQCDATNGNQAPTLTIVSPLNQAQITEGSTITLKADASDHYVWCYTHSKPKRNHTDNALMTGCLSINIRFKFHLSKPSITSIASGAGFRDDKRNLSPVRLLLL